MRNLFHTGLLDRLLFTAIVIGILMTGYGILRYLDLSNQLAGNRSAQIQASGGEVELQSKAEAQGLMASHIERRRLTSEQYNTMVIGGIGLAILGLGWLGNDLMRSRRRKEKLVETESAEVAQPAG